MSQITAFLKAIFEMKNEESINSMTMVRAAIWAEEKDFKKLTDTLGKEKKEEDEGFQMPKVPESWITN